MKLFDADVVCTEENTICGDEVTIYLQLTDETIAKAAFSGIACAVALAGAEALCGIIEKMKIADLQKVSAGRLAKALDFPIESPRFRCATLALRALESIRR